MFSKDVADRLKCYVYRLIDPRNGETFYVGKGRGNRVFDHVKAELGSDADPESQKMQRIREIRLDGFEVDHLIHRHGMDEDTAIEVEAALIDAYPEAANVANGQASDERGLMHSRQIIERYEAKEVEFQHRAIIINVNRTADDRDIYDAVRYAWRVDPEKARQAELVLAVVRGLIVGVFEPEMWVEATAENSLKHFPGRAVLAGKRWGFIGHPAPDKIAALYRRRRLPDSMRKRGAANPIRYVLALKQAKPPRVLATHATTNTTMSPRHEQPPVPLSLRPVAHLSSCVSFAATPNVRRPRRIGASGPRHQGGVLSSSSAAATPPPSAA